MKLIRELNFKKHNKVEFDPIHLFLIIILLFLLYVLWNENNINITNFLISAFASFVGAGSAFFLNTSHSKKKQKLENISSLEKTKYVIQIISKFNKQIKDHIDKFKNKGDDRYFEWEKITHHDSFYPFPNIDIDVANLLFLLEDKKIGKETLDSILLVDSEKQQIINILEKRNNSYSSYLDKTENRDSIEKDDLEKIIGVKHFKYLEQYTNHLIENNQNLLEDSDKALEKIKEFLKNY